MWNCILEYSGTSGSLLLIKKKRIHYSSKGRIEKSVPQDHHLSSLGKPRDAKWRSSGQSFLSYPHTHDGFLYSAQVNNIQRVNGSFDIFIWTYPVFWNIRWNISTGTSLLKYKKNQNQLWIQFSIAYNKIYMTIRNVNSLLLRWQTGIWCIHSFVRAFLNGF